MKNSIFLSLLLLLTATSGFSQSKQWASAKSKNTIESYQNFLRKFPKAEPYSSKARKQLILLEASAAITSQSITSYDYFIRLYSTQEYKEAAREWLINIEFFRAVMLNDTLEYNKFMERYPQSAHLNRVIVYKKIKEYKEIIKSEGVIELMISIQKINESIKTLIDSINSRIRLSGGMDLVECYAAIGDAYNLSGKIQNELKEDSVKTFKLAGDNYYQGSVVAQSQGFTTLIEATKELSGEPSGGYFQSHIQLSLLLANLKKSELYSLSADAYRNAGFYKHAEWMKQGGQIKKFDVNEIRQ
ncbi:MAG: hypothetical protein DYG98_13665 [Haliscomenobacteraceae bacterium CHB4]|nr:hypothetical protein [Haliscomenobacteraceae bacterium CHB4]